jgi:hypothetical protein
VRTLRLDRCNADAICGAVKTSSQVIADDTPLW